MVSNASELFPDPDSPVRTTSLSRGMSMSMFLRLCSRAPRTLIRSCRAMKQRSSLGALGMGICGDSSEQTIVICQCSIRRARRSGVSVRTEVRGRDSAVRRHDGHTWVRRCLSHVVTAGHRTRHPLRCQLYQPKRTDSSLIPDETDVFMREPTWNTGIFAEDVDALGRILLGSA